MHFDQCWELAHNEAVKHFPLNVIKQREFDAMVCDLVTGMFAGSPTIREHLISYAVGMQGDSLPTNFTVMFNNKLIGVQGFIPDGRFKLPGQFSFEEAVNFVVPLLKVDLSKLDTRMNSLLILILQNEYCFDNDPEDINQLESIGLTIRG